MPDETPLAADLFRKLVGSFPAGVTIVTTRDATGKPWGFTASSFTSVSMNPPLVLVCLSATADCHAAFHDGDEMAINVLATSQTDVAMRFASRGADKFGDVAVVGGTATSAPLISGAVAHIECKMHARHVAGDHTILIGQVVGGARHDGDPMVYHARAFGRFQAGG